MTMMTPTTLLVVVVEALAVAVAMPTQNNTHHCGLFQLLLHHPPSP